MASTKVRGITIELGADTSGISKALKGVNSEISSTSKQLKDVERLLKLDPTNTELLEQKQRLLGDRVGQTKEKLEQLKAAQEEVAKTLEETGEGQAQYDALQREIIKTEADLREAESAAASFNATTAKISATAGNLSKKFDNLAQKTRGLSMAAGGALVGLGGLAVKAGKDADELNTLAKQTGATTDELQKMQYASDLIDVDVDTITSGLKKLKKNLDGHEDTWKRLNVDVKNANGEYRDITDIFYDVAGALSGIENETERDVLAMDLFGKSADELAGIIDDGGAALKELSAQAEDMGVIISEEDLNAANEFNDALDTLKAEILPTIAQLGIEIIDSIMPYLPSIKESIEGVLEGMRGISPQLVMIVGAVLALTAALSPMFSVLSGITKAISLVTSSTGALGGALSGLSVPILAIVGVLAVLAAAFMHLWQTNDEFKVHMTGTWEEILASFNTFGDGITQRLNELGFNFQNIGEVIKAAWDEWCSYLAPILESTFDSIATILDGALSILTGLFDVWSGIFTLNWEKTWNGVKEIFSGIISAIKGVFTGGLNSMIGGLNAMITGLNKINVGGFDVNIPTIPTVGLASGGILTKGTALVGEAGPELLTMSNGRAVVQPLTNNTNNYAGATNNFYIQSNDPYAVAEQVSNILNQQTKQIQGAWA